MVGSLLLVLIAFTIQSLGGNKSGWYSTVIYPCEDMIRQANPDGKVKKGKETVIFLKEADSRSYSKSGFTFLH